MDGLGRSVGVVFVGRWRGGWSSFRFTVFLCVNVSAFLSLLLPITTPTILKPPPPPQPPLLSYDDDDDD